MKDVAKDAGVSVATVSLAFAHHPRIPASTRDRVIRAADALGYKTDPALQNMAAYRWPDKKRPIGHRIGIVHGPAWQERPAAVLRAKAIEAEAARRGYGVEPISAVKPGDWASARRGFIARGVSGLIFEHAFAAIAESPAETFREFAVVQCDSAEPEMRVETVMTDHFNEVVAAHEVAVRSGARRIGCAVCSRVDGQAERMRAAAAHMLAGRPKSFWAVVNPLVDGPITEAALRRWLRRERPDAVVADGRALAWLRAIKGPVPAIIALVAHENQRHGFAAFVQSSDIIGMMAVRLLDQMIWTGQRGLPDIRRLHLVESRFLTGRGFLAAPESRCVLMWGNCGAGVLR